jgi:flagellar M-ring protein FliF
MLLASPVVASAAAADATPALGRPDAGQNFLIESDDGRDGFLEALLARRDNGPERKLQKLVEFDENQAATILKQWIRQGANG